ncbi:MAG: YfhO family protein [Sphingomonadaceae bacterium]
MDVADRGDSRHFLGAAYREGAARVLAAHWPDMVAVCAYAAATAAFFWRIVVLGLVPVGYDLFAYFYPYKAYLAEVVRRGEFPLWNPMIFMGVPLLGNIQAAVLYPADLLFYLLPTTDALRYSTFLHVFLAGAFTYLFGRVTLRLSPVSAWLGGAVFAFGGFVGARVGHPNQLHAAVWLPLLLLCLEWSVERRSVRAAALGAVAFAVQVLAGHTQEVYYSVWALGLYALYLAVFGASSGRERLRPLWTLLGMLAVGLSIAGAQLLPSLELARESYRSGGIPFAEAVAFSVRLKELLSALVPLYAYAPYVEVTGYTGVISLVLWPAALAARCKTSHQWFFLGLGLLALLLSVGNDSRVYGWLFGVVPGFDLFRAPGRWLFLYCFSMSVLVGVAVEAVRGHSATVDPRRWLGRYAIGLAVAVAALVGLRFWLGGLDQELDLPHPRIVLNWWLFSSAGTAVVLLTFSRRGSRLLVGCLAALLMVDLYLAAEPLEHARPTVASLYTDPRPVYSSLLPDRSGRALSLATTKIALVDEGRLRGALSSSLEKGRVEDYLNYAKLKEALEPNVAMAFSIRSLDGYDGGLLPTRRYAKLKQFLLGAKEYKPDLTMRAAAGMVPDSRLLGYLGVDRLLVNRDTPGFDQGWVDETPESSSVRVLRNTAALPRAYVVHRHRVVADEEGQLDALRGLDLRETVVLEQEVEHEDPPRTGRDEVSMVRDGTNEVVVKASLEQPGFLVLSDSYYPGWKVYVDGREDRLLRANYLLRAVHLEPGDHEVRFVYDPLSFKLGLMLSAVGLPAALAASAWPGLLRAVRRPRDAH